MQFDAIVSILENVPHMPPERGKLIYEFVRARQPKRILELGFAHGTSTCYMAAALEENGGGRITTIDSRVAKQRVPDIHSLLDKSGLASFVETVYAERSYTWELLKLLEDATKEGKTEPLFDFVFIDGGHTWDSDGFSFLLADRLLKPGGWVLFDDVIWTPSVCAGEPWVDAMPAEERDVAHVEKIFNLLVVPHPDYDSFEFDGTWAWARKKPDAAVASGDRSDIVSAIYSRTNAARRSFLIRRYVKRLLKIGG
ncbi:MAG: class I SAM-dependent methyltransferase [Bacteroidetes bacterium]|nr:class I SAM-dependent methyltransferase [Bacteroidota bacterium]